MSAHHTPEGLRSCGYINVRPVHGMPGRYVCSVCGEVLRESYWHELPAAQRSEVERREPIHVASAAGDGERSTASAHTAGLLSYQENSDAYTHILRDGGNRIVATTQQSSKPPAEADARRLAACWNACDGIPTEELAPGAFESYIIEKSREICYLAAQRNELLLELRKAHELLSRHAGSGQTFIVDAGIFSKRIGELIRCADRFPTYAASAKADAVAPADPWNNGAPLDPLDNLHPRAEGGAS